jgi:uncharacterized cupredoxin-like copper-binding protein
MRRVRAPLVIAAAIILAATAIGTAVRAQEEGAAASEHPLLGSWIVDATPTVADDGPELETFHLEGSVRGVGPQGATVGSWEPTGARSADVTLVGPFTDPESGAFVGLGIVRGSIEVAEDGQTFTGTYTFEPPAAFAAAVGIAEGQLGPSDVSGMRIAVEPMGEAVAPIPEVLLTGPGASPSPQEGAVTIGVDLQEFAVIPESTTLPAGSITFEVENLGPDDPHELVIVRTDIPADELPTREDGGFDEEAEGVEVIGEIEEFAPGTSQRGTFALEPGHYAFLCNLVEEEDGELEAHYQFGMWVDVEVS